MTSARLGLSNVQHTTASVRQALETTEQGIVEWLATKRFDRAYDTEDDIDDAEQAYQTQEEEEWTEEGEEIARKAGVIEWMGG